MPSDSPLAARFINGLMRHGSRTAARKILEDALTLACRKLGRLDPERLLQEAAFAVQPPVETRPRIVGGAVYRVPAPISELRQRTLAVRLLLDAARAQEERPTYRRLAAALVKAVRGRMEPPDGGGRKVRIRARRSSEGGPRPAI